MNLPIKKHKAKDLFKTEKNIAPITLETYRRNMMNYYTYLQETGTPDGIEAVQSWLETSGSARTFNVRKAAIGAHLRKRFENEPMEKQFELESQLKRIKSKKPKQSKTESDYLKHRDVMKVAEEATPIISCIVLGLYWTGCRVSELINIKLTDCMVEDCVNIMIRHGKGDKERIVYMPVSLYDEIRNLFNGRVYLFETRRGNPYNKGCITREIHRQSKRILGKAVGAHCLRHSKAMYLKDDMRLSPDQVAKALGHSSVVTTLAFYYHGEPGPREQGII